MSLEADAEEIVGLAQEIDKQLMYRDQRRAQDTEQTTQHIIALFERMDMATQRIIAECESDDEQPTATQQPETPQAHIKGKSEKFYLSKSTRRTYLEDIGASEDIIERIIRPKQGKKHKWEDIEYTVYKPSLYGRIANIFVGSITASLMGNHKKWFDSLNTSLRNSDIHILSKTYVSMQLFTSLCIGFITIFFTAIGTLLFAMPLPFTIISSILLGAVTTFATFGIFYVYPSILAGTRRRKIKNDLPFVIINMAAVAGSGAQPISIFKLLLSSGDYKGVETDIKKIVNYVNLFGYDISTAMKTVAKTTPSKEFQDLLIGMVSTIESGGSLKSYLNSKADESMNTYKVERKKYVEIISTYSDIYTSVLIAAPLLFIVTLAIIGILGGTIAGVSVSTIAIVGTFIVLPLLNILFILFLNIIQPEI